MQTKAIDMASKITSQFDPFGEDFSIDQNLNCTDIATAYADYKAPLCDAVKDGFIELLALRVLSLPLEIGLCLLGIRVVLRNKVDVPKYEKQKSPSAKKDKKNKKKKKKDKDGEAVDPETDEP
mmetsp:Transcript_25520/g.34104  ORF Transcript_25520/g.34104 Transcript_25520/m.34104 type:complete len:123 (+) Transcript_25520:2018-2386(+)